MKPLFFLKSILSEALIILLLIFIYNNFLGNAKITIGADGLGYYDYLPSIFIHNDLDRRDKDIKTDSSSFARILNTGVYVTYHGDFLVNKYPCGTALLESPFFLFTWLSVKKENAVLTGYEEPFQRTIFHAAIFYLFLSLFFLRKTLKLYKINSSYIFFSQLVLVLGTSITHYVNQDASFSHIYSLFAITTFIYFVKLYFLTYNFRDFLLACVFLGLIFILRHVNIIILLFIPFLAGSSENLFKGFSHLFHNPKKVITGFLFTSLVMSLQCILWYLQTEDFFVYTYINETFDFSKPAFLEILFSYRKGLFIYTPIALIACFGLLVLIYKKQYYKFFTWFAFFISLTYLLSSWWSWYYGCSFGLRAFIDFYAVFFILFAILIQSINFLMKVILVLISLATIPVNLIQTYQYQEYILHWDSMDKEKFKKVFLKYGDNFKGLLWKKNYDYSQYVTVYDTLLPNISIQGGSGITTFFKIGSRNIPEFQRVSIIQVSLESDFQETDKTKMEVGIIDTIINTSYYFHNPYLTTFAGQELNKLQQGLFNFEFTPLSIQDGQQVFLRVYSGPGNSDVKLYNTRIKFLARQ